MDTVSEVKNLKKQLKKLKRTSGNADQLPESEFSLLEKECRELISNSTSVFNTVNILMRRLFTEQEIISHSVSGKALNSTTVAKPKFDTAKLELLKSLVIELIFYNSLLVRITKVQSLNIILIGKNFIQILFQHTVTLMLYNHKTRYHDRFKSKKTLCNQAWNIYLDTMPHALNY